MAQVPKVVVRELTASRRVSSYVDAAVGVLRG
jgi:hypothetical protein